MFLVSSVLVGCGDGTANDQGKVANETPGKTPTIASSPNADNPKAPHEDDTRPAIVRKHPALEDIAIGERVKYAMERLIRGPEPVKGLIIPDLHKKSLIMAQGDLIHMDRETLRVLSEPAVQKRFIDSNTRVLDGWVSVLSVLDGISTKAKIPVEVVRAWTEPALHPSRAHKASLSPLRRSALGLAVVVDNVAVADLLLRFLKNDPQDRRSGGLALAALVRFGSPWRERALQVAFESGGPEIWEGAPSIIARSSKAGVLEDLGVVDSLVWLSHLIETSGPPLTQQLPQFKRMKWLTYRPWMDPSVLRVSGGKGFSQRTVPVLPFPDLHGGAQSRGFTQTATVSAPTLLLSGRGPAATARCTLASQETRYPVYREALAADLRLEGIDDVLYRKALHCMPPGALADNGLNEEDQLTKLREAITMHRKKYKDNSSALTTLMTRIPNAADHPESQALVIQILREFRPLYSWKLVLESAYDLMDGIADTRRKLMRELLVGEDTNEASRDVAMHLIHRAYDPGFIPLLETYHDSLPSDKQWTLRRMLAYLYSRDVARINADGGVFAKRYRGWLDELDPRVMPNFAAGLLSMGEYGVEEFSKGLRGPKRRLFILAWPRDSLTTVPTELAKALVDPIDASTNGDEIKHVLRLAYATFPYESGPVLSGLLDRVDESQKSTIQSVLRRVRHRAEE